MRVAMTLLVRNEADIVDAQIAFHLNAGVDVVVATDNRSEDGTTEILERYKRAGRLHLFHEPGDDMRQGEWVTRMARFAATELGADWVIHSDADEFWWPRGGTLKDVFASIPARYGVVRGCWRHFLPRPDDGQAFWDRMTVRLCSPASPGDKATIFHAHQKVAHRGVAEVEIEDGNHNAFGPGLEPVRTWHPIEVMHFSLRSALQIRRKSEGGWLRNPAFDPPEHQLRLDDTRARGNYDAYFRSHVIDDEALVRGLREGTLEVDTRLRDALRALRRPDGAFAPPDPRQPSPLSFPMPDVTETAVYAGEATTLDEIDGIVRAERRVADVERRVEALERGLGAALAARASRLLDGRRLAPR